MVIQAYEDSKLGRLALEGLVLFLWDFDLYFNGKPLIEFMLRYPCCLTKGLWYQKKFWIMLIIVQSWWARNARNFIAFNITCFGENLAASIIFHWIATDNNNIVTIKDGVMKVTSGIKLANLLPYRFSPRIKLQSSNSVYGLFLRPVSTLLATDYVKRFFNVNNGSMADSVFSF